MTMTTPESFRALGQQISPPWMMNGATDVSDGAKVYWTHLAMLDHQSERARLGLLERFPDFATDDAIPYLCRDRRVIRGFAEQRPSINARLKLWRQSWALAGNAFGLMNELRAYLTGFPVRIRTVDNSGNWYTTETDGTQSYQWNLANWDWDGVTSSWSRFWVIIYVGTTGLWTDEGVWGDDSDLWGDGGVWGLNATADQISAIREIVRQRKPGGTSEAWTIIAFDDSSFSPASPEPDGSWGPWGKAGGGSQVESRLASARYVDGTGNLVIEV